MREFGIEFRERLAHRVAQYPSTHTLLRMVLFQFWVRLGLLLALAATAGGYLTLAKLWVVTPPGFVPQVKISGLDVFQARALATTARRQLAAEHLRDAAFSWKAAVANNPGDPELLRGYLAAVAASPTESRSPLEPLWQAHWLLRLTRTNLADLALTAAVYERFRLTEYLAPLLAGVDLARSPELQAFQLRALLAFGRAEEFAALWSAFEREHPTQITPELRLHHAAFLAGWGPVEHAAAAQRALDAAQHDPARQALAHRLQLRVSARRNDLDAYRTSLDALIFTRADTLRDHVEYWRMLQSAGRHDEAVQLARAHPQPPVSAEELVLLARVLFELGLPEGARQAFEEHVPQFSYADNVWLSYANLLVERKQWPALLELTLQMRRNETIRNLLTDFSYFLEGRAALATGQRAEAEKSFQRAAEWLYPNPDLALNTARQVRELGYAAPAWEILRKQAPDLARRLDYWQLLTAVAYDLRDGGLLLAATARVRSLAPDSSAADHNYAAALVINRQRPEEAVKLTFTLASANPELAAAQINHAAALAQNHRAEDALAVLAELNLDALNQSEAAAFHFARFEALLALRRDAEAMQTRALIDTGFLFDTQRAWLEKAAAALATGSQAPAVTPR